VCVFIISELLELGKWVKRPAVKTNLYRAAPGPTQSHGLIGPPVVHRPSPV
jgi:hypothetical protein